MREYEVTVLIQPKLDDEARDELIERLTGILTHGEEETDKPVVHQWGQRNLAYPINDHKVGYYVLFDSKLEPGRVAPIERDIQYMDDVLRHLVVRKDS